MRARTLVALLIALALTAGTSSSALAAPPAPVTRAFLPTHDISIKAAEPNGAYPPNFYYLYVRGDAFRATERTLLFFNVAPVLAEASEIISAKLSVYRAPGIGYSTPEPDPNVRVYRAAETWTEESAEWASQPEVTGAPSAWQGISVPHVGRYVNWDVTQAVRAWLAGEPNYGFVLSGRPDRADEQYTEFTVVFESVDSASDDRFLAGYETPPRGHSPRLRITYRPTGLSASPIPARPPEGTPTPTPVSKPAPKSTTSTKGAFIERVPVIEAPWWMSDFLARLLGYE